MELINLLTYITQTLAITGTICVLIQFAALRSAQRELRRMKLTTQPIYSRQREAMGQFVKNTAIVVLIWISFWLLYLAE